jgi:hypothetical protein
MARGNSIGSTAKEPSSSMIIPSILAAFASLAVLFGPIAYDFAQLPKSPSTATQSSDSHSMLEPERQRVLDAVITNLQQHYFDADVARRVVDALTAHERDGDDSAAVDHEAFAAALTKQMRDASHDLHLEVIYMAKPVPQASPEQFQRMLDDLKRDNCNFRKVEILPHGIGYLKFDAFLSPSDCGKIATAAMASLNNANALIIDLRDNKGGTAEMVSLIASYLFDHPEYLFDPRRLPSQQSWTSSPVAGSRLADKPVYILTSHTTISAAEQFTYNMKMLKRATIVGEVTAGGAHAGVYHPIDTHYGVVIPESRSINPYSPVDWEGVGVMPDIKVPADAALQTALRLSRTRRQNVSCHPQHDVGQQH